MLHGFVGSSPHLVAILVGFGLLIVLLLWKLPKFQVAHSDAVTHANRFDRENEARKTLAQIIGGVLVLAGLYSSVQTFDLQRQGEQLQQQGQITDRFTKAIDQLGALAPGGAVDKDGKQKINLEVRLGGIYALERISRDSPRDYWTIMEVLMAYVRENSPGLKEFDPQTGRPSPVPARADIDAISAVIANRSYEQDPRDRRIELRGTNLAGVNMTGGHLENAALEDADMRYSLLEHAHFNGADLLWTHLSQATLNWADFRGAILNNTDLVGCPCTHAIFSGSSTSMSGTNFNLAVLEEADFRNTQMRWTKFEGADLRGAMFEGADLRGVDFSKAKYLDPKHLAGAMGDSETLLPPDIVRPREWPAASK